MKKVQFRKLLLQSVCLNLIFFQLHLCSNFKGKEKMSKTVILDFEVADEHKNFFFTNFPFLEQL